MVREVYRARGRPDGGAGRPIVRIVLFPLALSVLVCENHDTVKYTLSGCPMSIVE